VARYGKVFKDRAVARLLPPESASVQTVSQELGVSVATLERWRADALSMPARERVWTAAARLQAVITTAAMDENQRSAWCRENGVYPSELEQWKHNAIAALNETPEERASPRRPGTHANGSRSSSGIYDAKTRR
jgi:transposase